MTSNELSPEEREQADKLFKAAQRRVMFGLAVLVLLLLSIVHALARSLFHFDFNLAGVIGPSMFGAVLLAHVYATREVRKEGLSLDRVERRFIPKTASRFEGEPINIRTDSTRNNGLTGLAVLLCVGALFVWLQKSGYGFSPLLVALGPFALLAGSCQSMMCLLNAPILRLDAAGAFNGAQHFWPQRARWSQITGVELMRFFDYKGKQTSRRLVFRDGKGKALVVVWLLDSLFSESQVEELLAQIEARLNPE